MNKTQLAVHAFEKNASSYVERFMDVRQYSEGLDTFLLNITRRDASILDIACGPGNVSRYLLDRHPYYRLIGIDLAPSMLEFAKKHNPTGEFQLLDCRKIGSLNVSFDGIVAAFALPYLSKQEAEQLVSDVGKLLAPGGMFYLSTMEGDDSRSGLTKSSKGDELYMYYHQASHLLPTLEGNGLRVIFTQWLPIDGGGDDLVLVARKE